MAGVITDAELRAELKRLGYEPGPVDDNTRSVYLKKLEKLREGKGNYRHMSNNDYTVASRQKNKSVRNTLKKHEAKEVRLSSDHSAQKMRLSNDIVSPKGPSALTVSNNSVHTREIDTSVVSPRNTVRSPISSFNAKDPSGHVLSTREDLSGPRNDANLTKLDLTPNVSSQSESFRDLLPNFTPQRRAGHTPTSRTYVYYKPGDDSESDLENDLSKPSSMSATISRVVGWLNRSNQSQSNNPLTNLSSNSFNRSGAEYKLRVSDTDNSDVEHDQKSPLFKRLYSSFTRNSYSRDVGTATSTSLLFTPPQLNEKRTANSPRYQHSIMSDDVDLDNAHHRRLRNLQNSPSYLQSENKPNFSAKRLSSTVSHVPNMILFLSLLLFLVLVLSYFILRDHHGEVGKLADIQKLICGASVDKNDTNTATQFGCLHQEDVSTSLSVMGVLYEILSRYAGEFHCRSGTLVSPRLSVHSAKALVEHHVRDKTASYMSQRSFQSVWENCLLMILNIGKPHFNVVAYDAFKMELGSHSQLNQIMELESLQPYFPGLCRIRRFVYYVIDLCMTTFWLLVLVLFISGMIYLIHVIRVRKLQALEKRANRVRELVAVIVSMLQHQLRESEANTDQPPHIPVYVLRERLRHEYKDVLSLWTEIVRYVYDVETCIGVQEWRGVGETWQWQGGTGWQGSALSDKSQKPSFVIPPTECVKIRNMFSTDSIDERGKRRIKRELLKKLSTCGSVVHIGLDSIGVNGLVYIKCADADTAGRVYHTIHANYFDGRLLTVKFLRDNKYCLRFPESRNMKQPLCLSDFE